MHYLLEVQHAHSHAVTLQRVKNIMERVQSAKRRGMTINVTVRLGEDCYLGRRQTGIEK